MQSMELLLQCIPHEYALHEIKNATVLVRRIAKHSEIQKEMRDLQHAIVRELESRKIADKPSDLEQ